MPRRNGRLLNLSDSYQIKKQVELKSWQVLFSNRKRLRNPNRPCHTLWLGNETWKSLNTNPKRTPTSISSDIIWWNYFDLWIWSLSCRLMLFFKSEVLCSHWVAHVISLIQFSLWRCIRYVCKLDLEFWFVFTILSLIVLYGTSFVLKRRHLMTNFYLKIRFLLGPNR